MSDNFSQKIISQLDKGISPIDIAEYFGGLDEFLKIISKYPYLKALVEAKLGGELEFYIDESEKRYQLPIQITGAERADDFEEMYDIYVDVVIPEVTDKSDIAILFNYLHYLEPDEAGEWAYYNNRKFNSNMIMTHVISINGINWSDMDRLVNTTGEEVERIIPDEYEI
jgi:hypothetical protein